jgi:hypothetical protein
MQHIEGGADMVDTQGRVTRFAADLVDDAAAEGARQSRSAKQQLDHWTRVGRAVSRYSSVARRRVEAALAGELPNSELTREEAMVYNAEVAARIEENLAEHAYATLLGRAGVTVVVLNDDGQLVERRPDGTVTVLTPDKSPSGA